MTLALRAAAAWLVLLVAMFANGAARVALLQPALGEDRARQVASLPGVLLVVVVSCAFVRLTPNATMGQLLQVGLAWLCATLAFEFLFGHYVSGLSWSALLADYNLLSGRLWSLIVFAVCFAPWACRIAASRARRKAATSISRRSA